jgi:hypothetical protein
MQQQPPRSDVWPRSLEGEGADDADRAYAGSTFREVREAVFANPYYRVWGAEGEPPLPKYDSTLWSMLSGVLSFGRNHPFFSAARRTLDTAADLRWGPAGRGVRRLLHPAGVCLFGKWEITQETHYTGYFRRGSVGLVIARYSTGGKSHREAKRSLSMVGKVYPTTDPADQRRLRPAAFITQHNFGGSRTEYINDADLRNAPDTRAWRRGLPGLAQLIVTNLVFQAADRQPTMRQLYEIAELGKTAEEKTSAPQFLRFLADAGQPRVPGAGLDFRDEVMAQIYDRGDPQPKRKLAFDVEVSDDGPLPGPVPMLYAVHKIKNWARIGKMTFEEAVVSHNGDFVIHFHHPKWRDDRNDPATAVRRGRRRVR